MEWLQTICNIIIIIGGACVGIKTIAEFFGKPITLFRSRSDKQLNKKIDERLKIVLPDILYAHDLETRQKYLKDREAYLHEIKQEILGEIQSELGQVSTLTKQYEALAISAKDVLREKIMAIYHKNKKDRTLSYHEKEALDQYYKDYKAIKGNSYIDKYYARMMQWAIIDDDYDLNSAL